MRCLGLTEERRRCPAEAEDGSGYCVAHRGSRNGAFASAPAAGSGLAGWLARRGGAAPHPELKDEARYDVPSWLRSSPTPTVIHHLLHDASLLVRWSAAFTLRKRRDPSAVDPLWQALQRDRSGLVRQQAAVALGKLGHPAVLGPLVEALWHDPDPGVRQACAVALGNLGYRDAAGDLAAALSRERAAFVRWDCVLALGQIGDRSVEPLLSRLAQSEPAEAVRNASRTALADIRRRG